jgi:mono/diheme cytochrome c family protein
VVNSANPNGKVMKLRSIQWWRLISGGFITLVAIQLVPYGREHVNPPTTSEPAWDSPATRALAKQACFDCHSNETEWPAYSHVAPASWLVQHDVDEGRAVVNFSDWHRPQEEATEAADEVTDGGMPPPIYRLLHAHARLSAADRERLARGLAKTLGASHEPRPGGK